MPSMNVTVTHALGAAEAQRRMESVLPDLKTRFADFIQGLDESWTGGVNTFTLKAKGMTIPGTVTVTDDSASLQAELPFAALFFKSTIESALREEATKLLSLPA